MRTKNVGEKRIFLPLVLFFVLYVSQNTGIQLQMVTVAWILSWRVLFFEFLCTSDGYFSQMCIRACYWYGKSSRLSEMTNNSKSEFLALNSRLCFVVIQFIDASSKEFFDGTLFRSLVNRCMNVVQGSFLEFSKNARITSWHMSSIKLLRPVFSCFLAEF